MHTIDGVDSQCKGMCVNSTFFHFKLREKSRFHPWKTLYDINQTSEMSHVFLYFIAKYNRAAQHVPMLAYWKHSLQLVDISIYFLVID